MTRILQTKRLSRSYGRRVGIETVDLELEPGTVFGFLGPNGAGKTTTIRLLLGFLRPTAGSAAIFGRDCWRESHLIKRDVGYLPSDLRLHPWMSGESALRVVGRIRGCDILTAGRRIAERFELEMDVKVRAMSRGMRQKLGIVLALAHKPRLLILDEPTSGLDPLMQDELARALVELASEGHTVFFSSHTLSEVEAVCNRVAIVRRGRIVADETIAALQRRARRRLAITFRDEAAAAAAEPPPTIAVEQRSRRVWTGELSRTAGSIRAWLAAQPVEDFVVGPPELETLFRAYYRDEESS